MKIPVIGFALLGLMMLLVAPVTAPAAAPIGPSEFDIIVYGGTSAGVTAAVQAKRDGKNVVLVEPGKHLGGLTSGGLGWTDLGNPNIVGGLAREFYHRLWLHYQQDAAWHGGAKAREAFRKAAGQGAKAMDDERQLMWVFEPHVAEKVFNDLVKEAKVPVLFGERLDLKAGVKKNGARITSIVMESGKSFTAKAFIDASYEGDLMAGAGVKYTVGREANDQYGETLNGIQAERSVKNQLPPGIDPYVVKSDPKSGLLPGVNANPGGADGSGDTRIQAYCYRMCLTDVPENRLMIDKPAGYDESQYELLFRAIEAGQKDKFFKTDLMPNRKTDSNNASGISTDFIGMNYSYPEATHTEREEIGKAHENWQRGLVWTVQNHPRVPEAIRKSYAKWGLPKDEFKDAGGWSRQLYIRESRRMLGEVVATEKSLRDDSRVERSIGMGAYAMDSHNTQRYVDANGHVRNEGDVQIGVPRPYRIDYGSIVPKAGECENLLVPVCLSATHIAYGSIRMEPVFMALGQSAATAAGLAIDDALPVQKVPYAKLQTQLVAAKQVLSWNNDAAAKAAPATPARVVCFGDSITAKGYPAVLAQMLGVSVANAGVNGNTSRMGLKRMERDVLNRKPELVVILFGTNDSRLDAPKVMVSVEEYEANLLKMIDACRSIGAKVVLCTMPPIEPTPYFTRHETAPFEKAGGLEAVLDRYRTAARRVAGQRNVPVVDLAKRLPEVSTWATSDGVHPTEDGAHAIATLIAEMVKPFLTTGSAAR